MDREKRILHLDMDAFFAAVEQRDYPFLRGKPVIIGGVPEGRGVVSTCSYEARKYGIRSAMSMAEANRLCPHAVVMSVNPRKYLHVSKQLLSILNKFSPKVEPISIDEAFMAMDGLNRIYRSEEEFGTQIKKEIKKQLGITATIGIAPTKIMAKLASNLEKPDGLTIIKKEDIVDVVYPLPVEKLWGVGDKTVIALNKLNIYTIGDLAKSSDLLLKKVFGIIGPQMVGIAAGKIDSPVLRMDELPLEKSVGHEYTFWSDTKDIEEIQAQILSLVQKVGRRLRKKNLSGRTITLKIRYDNFQTNTHRKSLSIYLQNEMAIYTVAGRLFEINYQQGRMIRLVGVSVSNLIQGAHDVMGLPFQDNLIRSKSDKKLLPAVDKIKDAYGEGSIWRASILKLMER